MDSQMTLNCDQYAACMGRKGPESGARPPVRAADAPKQAASRPRLGAVLFTAEQRCVVSHDAQTSLLPNALSADKTNRVTASAICESMT